MDFPLELHLKITEFSRIIKNNDFLERKINRKKKNIDRLLNISLTNCR